MARKAASFPAFSAEELLWGWGYLIFQLLALPEILNFCNRWLGLSPSELNFTFFLINFVAVCIIFRRFLSVSAAQIIRHPGAFFEAVILGLCAFYACTYAITWCIRWIQPGFSNVNDESITALSLGSRYLMTIGTVLLVPPAEECFYRGLFFRTLYGKSHWAAYLASIIFFALLHIIGYIGKASPLTLVLCFFQYLPAGLCLAWSYIRGETIFAPILIHAIINARSIGILP